jgi:uncharacterized membrane protein
VGVQEWLTYFSEKAILALNAVAVLIIVLGALEALIGMLLTVILRRPPHEARAVYIKFARWLVAALTFQLAADLIETSVSTTWQTIGRVGIVALIRTFLNFFLERDIEDVRARQRAAPAAAQKVSEQKTS